MSRYSNQMTEILDAIFEAYTVDGNNKLVVKNESASDKAKGLLHDLVLEKARDMWDRLEAAQDSLSGVAEEIRFEEMTTDPSSMSNSITHEPPAEEDPAAAAAAELEGSPALESASISELLSPNDLNFDDIFENMDHLDAHQNTNVPAGPDMPFDENMGGMNMDAPPSMSPSTSLMADEGDDDFQDLEVGMGGEMDDMDSEVDPGMGDDEFGGDEMGADPMGDDGMGDDPMAGGDEMGMDDGGFDFDLDIDDGMDDMEGGMGDEFADEEPEVEGMGHNDMSYRMESKGDDDKDDDDDDDDDKDDDDKPAFLKKGDDD